MIPKSGKFPATYDHNQLSLYNATVFIFYDLPCQLRKMSEDTAKIVMSIRCGRQSQVFKDPHKEIICRFKAGNSCYYSGQTVVPSLLLCKNLKIKIHKTIILPVVLYGCETWSLTLREECRLRVFENRILRRIFGPKRDENS